MMNNRFVVVVPVRNAEPEIARCMYSIWAQTHQNWQMIIIDDNSEDGTVAEVRRFLEKFTSAKDKVTLIENDNQCHALPNILTGISMCDDDDIVCHVDGDDWICDMDAFSIINEQYNHGELNVGAVWTNQRWGFTINGNSGPMPQDVDVYKHDWVSSHLKTFRKRLINDVNMENFYDPNGNYFQRVADQAFYLPVLKRCQDLEMTYTFLPICAYHYNVDHNNIDFESVDSKYQHNEAAFLRNRGFVG